MTDAEIIAARPERNQVDSTQPYSFLAEREFGPNGRVLDTSTIFLTNRECPFRCVMCDLWMNTTTTTVPPGAIPGQIQHALQRLPSAQQIKLYNSGNFFDSQAIPTSDHPAIAELVSTFETVIVENHPRLCTERCGQFQDQCGIQLEVAMGLETSDSKVLASLNKQMTTDDFAAACRILLRHGIRIRSFILLRPPGVTEEQGAAQALSSLEFAFDCGVECCSIIPVRSGNGIMNQLQANGQFSPPALRTLETVQSESLSWNRGRVFADLWDESRLRGCDECRHDSIQGLRQMNLTQQSADVVECPECRGENG